MSCSLRVRTVAAVTLLVANVGAAEPEFRYGPPTSPLSWQAVEKLKSGAARFSVPSGILGVSKEPALVQKMDFHDGRPYGELENQNVWLVRYESVSIEAPSGKYAASVNLSVALDVETGGVICAFTDPAPSWAQPAYEQDIEAKAAEVWGETPRPAQYATLHAKLTEVLAALWKKELVDPSKAGQIILRPRFFSNTWPKKEINGEHVPVYTPSNMWIVEVLGRAVEERYGTILTSIVAVFFDDGLVWLRTSVMF